jgi:hypothetical protein
VHYRKGNDASQGLSQMQDPHIGRKTHNDCQNSEPHIQASGVRAEPRHDRPSDTCGNYTENGELAVVAELEVRVRGQLWKEKNSRGCKSEAGEKRYGDCGDRRENPFPRDWLRASTRKIESKDRLDQRSLGILAVKFGVIRISPARSIVKASTSQVAQIWSRAAGPPAIIAVASTSAVTMSSATTVA